MGMPFEQHKRLRKARMHTGRAYRYLGDAMCIAATDRDVVNSELYAAAKKELLVVLQRLDEFEKAAGG